MTRMDAAASAPAVDDASFRAELRERARKHSFDICRVTPAALGPKTKAQLRAWLDTGAHGDMGWMEETFSRRGDPRALWSDAVSVVVLGTNYGPASDPLEDTRRGAHGAVAAYARRRDYHDVVKGRLKQLAGWIAARLAVHGPELKVFVDTAPVMEKPLAERAGVGWQGKHTNLVSRDFGSWLLLGSIFVNVDLGADDPESDHCGSCRACLDICPTRAFDGPYRLDARRCISYLTIEHKGPIPRDLREGIGNRVFGCDDCLAVCPWNKYARTARDAKLAERRELASAPLAELAAMDDAAFRARFQGTPVKRLGVARFLRNVLVAVGNSGRADLVPAALARLDHGDAIVRQAAVWALSRLMTSEQFWALAGARASREPDPDVAEEWTLCAAALRSPRAGGRS